MGRNLMLLSLLSICGLALGGCCKSLQCAAQQVAERQLGCKKIKLSEVSEQLRRDGRDLPADRRVQQAKGCGKKINLECGMVSSGVVSRETTNAAADSSAVPPEFADPQWRCWVLPEPLPPLEDKKNPDIRRSGRGERNQHRPDAPDAGTSSPE